MLDMDLGLTKKTWWNYIEEDIRELLKEASLLSDIFENRGRDLPAGRQEFHDYAFVVFPAAKAYEGFLKKLFLDLGFIAQDDYYGKRFRVGKALNPNLEKFLREKESVYDKIVDYCQGKELADKLWETWVQSRNLIFHWFPNEKRAINFDEAKERIVMIVSAMDAAFRECKLNTK